MNWEIRTLKNDELEMLAELADRLWHQSYSELLSPQQIDYMVEMFQSVSAFRQQISEKGYCYRGLFIDGKLSGFTGNCLEDDHLAFLSKLYLDEKYHGQGFGRKLLDDAISLYPQAESIYLTVNKHNPSYYKYLHMGFKVIDSVVTDIGEGFVMDDYIMEKEINR